MTESIGIRTPKIRKCQTKEDVRNAVKEIGFPLLVNPVDLTGGKGVKTCIEINETIEAFRLFPRLYLKQVRGKHIQTR